MSSKSDILISPARNIAGAISIPGDKSISHRYAMLAAIASGTSGLRNFSSGADCGSTLNCVQDLGVRITRGSEESLQIEGAGGQLFAPKKALDCGNSGSTMRMLAGILAAQPFRSELIGDQSLSRRPMARIAQPLRQMGAQIELSHGDRPPVQVHGRKLKAIHYKPSVASAQVKSAVLFAGIFANGETSVQELHRTRDHGELALRAFGAEVNRSRNTVSVQGGQELHAIQAVIPGDISSAAFFLCASALFPGSNLVIEHLLMNPTRAVILDVLTMLGAKVHVLNLEEKLGELVGTVKVEPGNLRGAVIAGGQAAQLIDELPVLAAIAPYTEKGMEIKDAHELRVKETDRISAVTQNLRAMGAAVEERDDGWRIPGGQSLHGAEVSSFDDHRIAMAFAIAALCAKGDTLIQGADAARVSFPEFFALLDQVVAR